MRKKFKVGDIVKLTEKTRRIHPDDSIFNNIVEIDEISNGKVDCKFCQRSEKCAKNGEGIWFTRGEGICSKAIEHATDREAFLYHVAGLRERLE